MKSAVKSVMKSTVKFVMKSTVKNQSKSAMKFVMKNLLGSSGSTLCLSVQSESPAEQYHFHTQYNASFVPSNRILLCNVVTKIKILPKKEDILRLRIKIKRTSI